MKNLAVTVLSFIVTSVAFANMETCITISRIEEGTTNTCYPGLPCANGNAVLDVTTVSGVSEYGIGTKFLLDKASPKYTNNISLVQESKDTGRELCFECYAGMPVLLRANDELYLK